MIISFFFSPLSLLDLEKAKQAKKTKVLTKGNVVRKWVLTLLFDVTEDDEQPIRPHIN